MSYYVSLLLAVTMCSSCSTVQGNFTLLDGHELVNESEESIDIYHNGLPTREYRVQARLDAHFERTHFLGTSLEEGIKQLEIQARLSGSQAIINIEESQSRVGETKISHFSAIGIRYMD